MNVADIVSTMTVEARIIGQRASLQPAWQIALPATLTSQVSTGTGSPFRLRDLIAYIVQSEVDAFRQRQQVHRLLSVLSPQQIVAGASRGKITPGGAPDLVPSTRPEHRIDKQEAIVTAWQAFDDGLYFVFFNGFQQRSLDDEVLIKPASTVTFIRLVALIGG